MPKIDHTLNRAGTPPAPIRPTGLVGLLDRLGDWADRARQRRTLMTLDDRLLADIGRSRADADAEYRKPPWR